MSLFAPLKILETPSALLPLEILSPGEPLLQMGGAACFGVGIAQKKKRWAGRDIPGHPVYGFYFSLSSASSLLLESSPTGFHHSGSQLTLICFHLKL